MLFQTILTSTLSLFFLPLFLPFAAPAPVPVSDTEKGIPIAIRSSATGDTTLNPCAFSSRITWFNTGLGACGFISNDSQLVAALNAPQFNPSTANGNPNNNSLCNQRIRVNANGRGFTVTIVDRCPTCPYGGLDLSPAAFGVLGSTSVGVL